ALAKDCEIAAVKIGMLGNRANAAATAEFLDAHKFAHVVLDPVINSSTGAELLDASGIKFVSTELLKRASVITPNIPETEVLTGLAIKDQADMETAARKRSEEHTSELQSRGHLVCRLLLEKKKNYQL